HVLRVRGQRHAARAPERLESADRGGELHAVVGGRGFGARQRLLGAPVAQEHPPAAGPRVAAAGAVREQFDFLHADYALGSATPEAIMLRRACQRMRTGVSGATRLRASTT